MDMIFKEYSRVIWQKKWFFLLALFGLTSAITLDLSAPVYYKNIANELAKPYTDSTLELLLVNLKLIAITYAGVWLSWRLMDITIVPLSGGVNLMEKRCFDVLKQQKYVFFESSFSGSLIRQANRFAHSYAIIIDWFLFQLLSILSR